MKFLKNICLIFSIIFSLSTNFLYASEAENKAISDWVNVQKNYPQTTTFEKVDNKTYHFKNEGIGYDGKLYLENVIIDKMQGMDTKSAEFMVRLDVSEEKFYEARNRSYSRWQETNNLLFDKSQSQWVTHRNYDYVENSSYSSCEAKNEKNKDVWSNLWKAAFPILLTIGLFWLFLRMASSNTKPQYDAVLESNKDLIKSNEQLIHELKKLTATIQEKEHDKYFIHTPNKNCITIGIF